jgi:hypothetical protein
MSALIFIASSARRNIALKSRPRWAKGFGLVSVALPARTEWYLKGVFGVIKKPLD